MTKTYTISVDDGSGQKYRIYNQPESVVRELGLPLYPLSNVSGERELTEPINRGIFFDRDAGIIRHLDSPVEKNTRTLESITSSERTLDEPINSRIQIDREAGTVRRV